MKSEDVMIVKCPNCAKDVIWDELSPWRPFCSKRCQLIDWENGPRKRNAFPVAAIARKAMSGAKRIFDTSKEFAAPFACGFRLHRFRYQPRNNRRVGGREFVSA